jgi:hypothetical protein
LPFEKDVSIAEAYLKKIKNNKNKEIDGRKITLTVTKNLAKNIEKFKNFKAPVGHWKFVVSFYTEHLDNVEQRVHNLLNEYLNESVNHGEIFNCSSNHAVETIYLVLKDMGLSELVITEKNGEKWHSNPNQRHQKTYLWDDNYL